MIVGAGEAGYTLLKEIQNSKFIRQNVCCLVDDDPGKRENIFAVCWWREIGMISAD